MKKINKHKFKQKKKRVNLKRNLQDTQNQFPCVYEEMKIYKEFN